jgi:hypothetical protein
VGVHLTFRIEAHSTSIACEGLFFCLWHNTISISIMVHLWYSLPASFRAIACSRLSLLAYYRRLVILLNWVRLLLLVKVAKLGIQALFSCDNPSPLLTLYEDIFIIIDFSCYDDECLIETPALNALNANFSYVLRA